MLSLLDKQTSVLSGIHSSRAVPPIVFAFSVVARTCDVTHRIKMEDRNAVIFLRITQFDGISQQFAIHRADCQKVSELRKRCAAQSDPTKSIPYSEDITCVTITYNDRELRD
jgi:hypothetical protein